MGDEGKEISVALNQARATLVGVPDLRGDSREHAIEKVKTILERVDEMIQQHELKVRNLPPHLKGDATNGLRDMKQEAKQLTTDLRREVIRGPSEESNRKALFGGHDSDEASAGKRSGKKRDESRIQLLSQTERVENSSSRIHKARAALEETEGVAQGIITELGSQRDTILRSRDGLRATNDAIGRSHQVVRSMMRRAQANRVMMKVMIAGLVIMMLTLIYYKLTQ